MNIVQEAAQSLRERALQALSQSESNLLIDAAKRLDPNTDAEAIKKQWLEQWLTANQNRKGSNPA